MARHLGFITRWRILIALLFGAAIGLPVGVGGYVFYYGKGYSYLLDDPKACMNCHVMREQFQSWSRSSHHTIATCNTCHTPGNFMQKYLAKAENGFWHSYYFTTGGFPEPIRIKPRNLAAVERACKDCHRPFLEASGIVGHRSDETSCTSCHRSAGHGPGHFQ